MVLQRFLRLSLGTLLIVQLPGCAHLCHSPPAEPIPVVSRLAPSGRVLIPGPVYSGQPLPQVTAPLAPPGPSWRAVPDPRVPADPQAPGVRMYPPEWRAVPDSQPPAAEPPLADPANPRARLLPP